MIWRGINLFSFHDLGELWKIPNENDIEHREGGQLFFSWKRKGNENMLLDAPIIPLFYFISIKCWYSTRVWNLMHDTHFLCYKVCVQDWLKLTLITLLVLALLILTLLALPLQELKDDLLDDTAWPFLMQWFNKGSLASSK